MGIFDWLFRDRTTGKITIAQSPNWSLGVFLAAAGLRWLTHPTGTAGSALDVVATGALVVWSADEMVRGVNPWRRILGTIVLAATVVGITKRLTN